LKLVGPHSVVKYVLAAPRVTSSPSLATAPSPFPAGELHEEESRIEANEANANRAGVNMATDM
jgi:hypothetical protein